MSGKVCTGTELRAILGIHGNTLSAWVHRGCPVIERGGRGRDSKFNIAAVVRWREDQAAQAATGNTEGVSLDEARLRKVAGEAALVEIEVAKKRGELVEIEVVAQAFGEQCANVRARLLPMPSKLAPLLAATSDLNEVQALLEQGIHEALSELSGDGITGGPAEGDSRPDVGEPEAPAEAEGQRVGRRKAKVKP